MFDIAFSKLALIGLVSLIVIGPEKLPRVARTVGTLLGKAQRYVNDVKAEVNRSIELDELKKVKENIESAAREVESTVRTHASDFQSGISELERSYADGPPGMQPGPDMRTDGDTMYEGAPAPDEGVFEEMPDDGNNMLAEFAAQQAASAVAPVSYQPPRKNWRTQRNAVPHWYKARQQVKSRLRSGAAMRAAGRVGKAGEGL